MGLSSGPFVMGLAIPELRQWFDMGWPYIYGTLQWSWSLRIQNSSCLRASSFFIVPFLTTSSICVPAAVRDMKFGKYYANKYLWYIGKSFFTTIVKCSFSLGLFIICRALDFHLVIKVENDSLGSCLVVSRSLRVMSPLYYTCIAYETLCICLPRFNFWCLPYWGTI